MSETPKTSFLRRLSSWMGKQVLGPPRLPSVDREPRPPWTPEQVQALSRLRSSPDFWALQAVWAGRVDGLAERMLQAQDYAEYKEVVGAFKAYVELAHIVEIVLQKDEELNDHARHRSQREQSSADKRASTFYASRYWKPAGTVPVPARPEQAAVDVG